jgi:hypothetical protein
MDTFCAGIFFRLKSRQVKPCIKVALNLISSKVKVHELIRFTFCTLIFFPSHITFCFFFKRKNKKNVSLNKPNTRHATLSEVEQLVFHPCPNTAYAKWHFALTPVVTTCTLHSPSAADKSRTERSKEHLSQGVSRLVAV